MKGQSSLDVFDFGVLLQALAGSGKVGTLKVVSGAKEKYIILDEGRVEAIYTPRSKFRIGRILFNMHAVEMEQIRAVLEDQQEGRTDLPLGQELVKRGVISDEELEAALRYQIVEEILEVFYWRDVSYEFFSGSPDRFVRERGENLTRVGGPQDASGILLHVTKFLDDMDKFNRITPSTKDVYELTEDPTGFLKAEGLPPEIGDLVSLIDGVRDMGEVLRQLRLNRFEAMELFYRLRSEGFLRPKNSFELLMLAENQREVLPASKRARLYERASELGVEGFDVSFRSAQAYEEMGKTEKAAERYFEHSRRLEEEGNLETAVARVAKAVELCPQRTDFRRFRADMLIRLNRVPEAADEFLQMARIQQDRGQPEEAEKTLQEALGMAPGRDDLLVARAEILVERGERRRAALVFFELTLAREARNERDAALEAIRGAIRIRPRSFWPRRELSRLLETIGDCPGAAAAIGGIVPIAMERCRDKPDRARRVLALLKARIEELHTTWHPAMTAIAEASLEIQDTAAALATLVATGEARIAEGRLSEAKDAYQKAVELAPQDLDLAETLALVHARLGSREHAIARLRGIAGLYWKRGKLDRAERALREILRLDPFSPDALLEMARLRADQGRRKEAAEGFNQLGLLYRTSGDLEAAVTYFDEACRLDPSNPDLVKSLAEGLGRTLKVEKARDTFDALLAMLRARGDHTGVIEVAFRLLTGNPQHEEAIRALIDAWNALGKRVKAWSKHLPPDALRQDI